MPDFEWIRVRSSRMNCDHCCKSHEDFFLDISKSRLSRTAVVSVALTALLALSGCNVIGVKPWDRDLLARRSMQWDSDSVDAALDDHVYFSKEASSGGRSFGGGGCGCN